MARVLSNFTSGSFEQFVQALAVRVFGNGVSVFGSGPDGGREATFSGRVPYPSAVENWDGYGVIQAKYKEKLETTAVDQRWALSQLKAELDRFVSHAKTRRQPQYYVFVTNVVLTPVSGSGGKDQADALIRRYYRKLSLKGHSVWDRDSLLTHLEAQPGLADRFRIQTTPEDVLNAMLAELVPSRPQFEAVAQSYLDRELRAEEDAKLDQAGRRTDERTPLADVFVDLCATPEPSQEPHQSERQLDECGVVQELLLQSELVLDPASSEAMRLAQRESELQSRFVLMGGPGSGKSTVGQFLAQINRAALLQREPPESLTPESRRAVERIAQRCKDDGLPWPRAPRYPFRTDLSSFAQALADGAVHDLLEYLTSLMRGNRSVTPDDLRTWLKTYPWLLVLDGLDEVPATSNRDAVCRAIQDFLSEAAQVNANLLVVATTRIQGYGGEFGRDTYVHRYIAPLSREVTLKYVRRFAEAKYGCDSPKVAETESRISEAMGSDLTAKLMQTPLQATFMVTLVAAGGRPPQDRWRLFNEYYETIYKRETQKVEAGLRQILEHHHALIARLHHEVGYLLQVRSEAAGGTDATLPLSEVRNLVAGYLAEDGWESESLEAIVESVVVAATTRLVFLTSRIASTVGFDVRSLQEYMAAERLASGNEQQILDRLRRIATSGHWRNVLLFVCGRFFGRPEQRHLQSWLPDLCDELLDTDGHFPEAVSGIGPMLALDALEDGTATTVPRHAKRLVVQASLFLDGPNSDLKVAPVSSRLAAIRDGNLHPTLRSELSRRAATRDGCTSEVCRTLLEIAGRGNAWAEQLLTERCQNEAARAAILRAIDVVPAVGPVHLRLAEEALVALRPAAVGYLRTTIQSGKLGHEPNGLFHVVANLIDRHVGRRETRVWDNSDEGLPSVALTYVQVFPSGEDNAPGRASGGLGDMSAAHPGWKPFVKAAEFMVAPDSHSLMQAIEGVAGVAKEDLEFAAHHVPWPFGAALKVAASLGLDEALRQAATGKFGNRELWETVESRWAHHGVHPEDFEAESQEPSHFPSGEVGLPPIHWISVYHNNNIRFLRFFLGNPDLLARVLSSSSFCDVAEFCLWLLSRIGEGTLPLPGIDPLERLFHKRSLRGLLAFDWAVPDAADYLDALERLGKLSPGATRSWGKIESPRAARLGELLLGGILVDPQRIGLLKVLSSLAERGYNVPVPRDSLDFKRWDADEPRLDAVLVGVAAGNVSNPLSVASEILRLDHVLPNQRPLNRIAVILQPRVDVHFELAVALLRQMPQRQGEAASVLAGVVRDGLIGRETGLGSADLAASLSLPLHHADVPTGYKD